MQRPQPPSAGFWLLLIVCGGALALARLPASLAWLSGVLILAGGIAAAWVIGGYIGGRLLASYAEFRAGFQRGYDRAYGESAHGHGQWDRAGPVQGAEQGFTALRPLEPPQ